MICLSGIGRPSFWDFLKQIYAQAPTSTSHHVRPRDPQSRSGPIMTRMPTALPCPLHANPGIVAQPSRALVRRSSPANNCGVASTPPPASSNGISAPSSSGTAKTPRHIDEPRPPPRSSPPTDAFHTTEMGACHEPSRFVRRRLPRAPRHGFRMHA